MIVLTNEQIYARGLRLGRQNLQRQGAKHFYTVADLPPHHLNDKDSVKRRARNLTWIRGLNDGTRYLNRPTKEDVQALYAFQFRPGDIICRGGAPREWFHLVKSLNIVAGV